MKLDIKCPLRVRIYEQNEPVHRDVIGPSEEALAREEEKERQPGFCVQVIRPGHEDSNYDLGYWGPTIVEVLEFAFTNVAEILINSPAARENWPRTEPAPEVELEIVEPVGN